MRLEDKWGEEIKKNYNYYFSEWWKMNITLLFCVMVEKEQIGNASEIGRAVVSWGLLPVICWIRQFWERNACRVPQPVKTEQNETNKHSLCVSPEFRSLGVIDISWQTAFHLHSSLPTPFLLFALQNPQALVFQTPPLEYKPWVRGAPPYPTPTPSPLLLNCSLVEK